MSPAEKPTPAPSPRARRVKIDEQAVVMQVARIGLTLRSLTLIVENLALDLGLSIGVTPREVLDETHVSPATPKHAKVHVEPTIEAWAEGLSHSLTSKLDEPPAAPADSDRITARAKTMLAASSSSSTTNGTSLKKGARTILEVLAAVAIPLSRQRIATLTGISKRSGSFSTYVSDLRSRGFIVDEGDALGLTDEGRSHVGHVEKTSEEKIREMWHAKLTKGARTILASLRSMHPSAVSRTQLATLAGLSPRSGSFSTYLSKLRANALIDDHGSTISLTDEGLIVAGPKTKRLSKEEILERWTSSLQGGARRILELLVDVAPKEISYVELGEIIGVNPRSGSFSTYISKLRSNGLIETHNGRARANSAFL